MGKWGKSGEPFQTGQRTLALTLSPTPGERPVLGRGNTSQGC